MGLSINIPITLNWYRLCQQWKIFLVHVGQWPFNFRRNARILPESLYQWWSTSKFSTHRFSHETTRCVIIGTAKRWISTGPVELLGSPHAVIFKAETIPLRGDSIGYLACCLWLLFLLLVNDMRRSMNMLKHVLNQEDQEESDQKRHGDSSNIND